MANPILEAKRVLTRAKALPVLFVGSGISRRYLNAPNWDELLAHFATRMGRSLAYYRSMTNESPDQPAIASLIEPDFHKIWWDSEEYAASREKHGASGTARIRPLKIEMARHIESLAEVDNPAMKEELEKLAGARVHAIVTTNWDHLLKKAFPDFKVFVGQEEVIFSRTYGVGEIYKIHGSVERPNSIIVTKEDYADFDSKNAYLVAKLLTMFVEHPVIFMGYSLSDPHIQALFGEIVNCLSTDNLKKLNERIIFLARSAKGQPDEFVPNLVSIGSQHLQVYDLRVTDFGKVYDMLAELHEFYPVKLLRRLRRDIFHLAYETKPSALISVADLNDDTDLDKVEVVIGVGRGPAEVGYTAMGRTELVEFMLKGVMEYDTDKLMNHAIPRIFRGNAIYAPIFYPMFVAGRLDDTGVSIAPLENCPNGQKLLTGEKELRPYRTKDLAEYRAKSFRDLLAEGPTTASGYGVSCTYDIEDVLELRKFLLNNDEDSLVSDTYWRLACKFDALVFGPDFAGDRAELHKALNIVPPPKPVPVDDANGETDLAPMAIINGAVDATPRTTLMAVEK